VKEQLVERLKPFPLISSIRERTPFPAELLDQLPNLKLLLNTSTRNKAIDTEAAKRLGITVTGTTALGRKQAEILAKRGGALGPDSTTQHTVALILGLVRNIAADDVAVKSGLWQTGLATSMAGKTFSVLGLGRLGVATARIMYLAFGMRVIAWSTSLTQEAADQKAKEAGLPVEGPDGEKTFLAVSKEELFKQADVLSVHYVLSDRSRGIVSGSDLALMKPSAFIVNTSRGPLINESDLLAVLEAGKIRGAALDVFELEPLPLSSKWRNTEWGKNGTSRVLLTPHMGYVEEEVLRNWYDEVVENIISWTEGRAEEIKIVMN
jgi:lactate dehydrogenase-like 2-hydroxyacid dehydrogenase